LEVLSLWDNSGYHRRTHTNPLFALLICIMSKQINPLDTKNILKYFLLIFLIVHIELFITVWIVTQGMLNKILHIGLAKISISFFLILLSLQLIKRNVFLRNKPAIFYLFINFVIVLLFIFLYSQLHSIICKNQQILTGGCPAIRHRFLFIFLVSCSYILFLVFFSSRNLMPTYISSVVLFLTLQLFSLVFLIWRNIGYGVGRIVFLLLKISGLNPVFLYDGKVPIVGTGSFNVRIYALCAGLEGIFSFLIAFAAMVIFSWKRIDKAKALAVVYIGTFLMYVINILRIYIFILVGHFIRPELAEKLWHSYGSLIFYVLAIILILNKSKKWIAK